MKTLSIDIETYGGTDLGKCSVYRYSESVDFEILLFAYSADGAPPRVIDMAAGERLPEEIVRAVMSDDVIKHAYNASFERVCLSRHLQRTGRLKPGEFLNPAGWRCTMVWAAYMGLPLSLEGAGAALGLDKQKLTEGKKLIRYFCSPCPATRINGGRTRNLPRHAPEKWELFKRYNIRDVEVEMGIRRRLIKFPVPESVWAEYLLDQEINDRGVRLDTLLVGQAIRLDARSKAELLSALKELTGLDNPNSVLGMRRWLAERGLDTASLDRKTSEELMRGASPEIRRVLELRLRLARSAVKKYTAMRNAVCADGRARGMFRFYGAARTGRFSSRIIQLQNLARNTLPDLPAARELVRRGDYAALEMLYEDVPDTLSQLVRTAFVPRPGCRFYVADFSAIEARVIAWLAGEKWKSEAFAAGRDIYCATASQMFRVPVEKHGVNAELRQKGKIAELSCGYGGTVQALKNMGADKMGLSDGELRQIVTAWRAANPQIVRFWGVVDKAVMAAVQTGSAIRTHGLTFRRRSGMLFITLPSGRSLAYSRPEIGSNGFGAECVTYEGVGADHKWGRLDSYGPKFVENIVQAVARDILCHAMLNLRDKAIVMHIHDELVIEAEPGTSLEELCGLMSQTPPWAAGLVLKAEGYVCDFYQKQ